MWFGCIHNCGTCDDGEPSVFMVEGLAVIVFISTTAHSRRLCTYCLHRWGRWSHPVQPPDCQVDGSSVQDNIFQILNSKEFSPVKLRLHLQLKCYFGSFLKPSLLLLSFCHITKERHLCYPCQICASLSYGIKLLGHRIKGVNSKYWFHKASFNKATVLLTPLLTKICICSKILLSGLSALKLEVILLFWSLVVNDHAVAI